MSSSSPCLPLLPPLTREEVLACQFSRWYRVFSNSNIIPTTTTTTRRRRRNNYTIPSVILSNLPSSFSEYLLSDGVILPQGASELSSLSMSMMMSKNNSSSDSSDDEWSCGSETQDDKTKPSSSSNNDTTTTATATFHFPKLNQQIQQAIVDLGGGGGVVPKLNWSSPRDAVWINGYSLQCRTVGDVYLLLKSSDFVLHDVLYAFDDVAEVDDNHDDAPELELVLRKWCNLHPSMEFRCFVWQKQLIAISQRHDTQQFDHLASVPSSAQDDIQQLIHTFFHEIVQTNFSLNNYCLDVYVDKQQRVWVLDFNVWHTRTDALLFTWKELMELATNTNTNQQQCCEEGESTTTTTTSTTTSTCCCCKIVFRVVQESQVQQDPLASYRAPTDMTTTIPYLTNHFEEFMNMCQKPSEYHDNDTTSSSSSSDNDVKEEGKDELE